MAADSERGDRDASVRLVALRSEPLSARELLEAVRAPAAGAVVLFAGSVRDHNEGRPVLRLEYEAYASMAEKEMRAIAEEIAGAANGLRLAVVHRVGALEVGEDAVLCAASAPHREQAFEACRALIDRIKQRVPIWKREHGPDGPYWVGWEDARCGPGRSGHDHDHGQGPST